jgi:hypothetical protein
MRSVLLGALAMVALVAGCGGGGGGGSSDAVDLTKWLPRGTANYQALDFAAFKDALGLDEDADPRTNPKLDMISRPVLDDLLPESSERSVAPGLADAGAPGPNELSTALLDAIDPASITAAAVSRSEVGRVVVDTAVFATTADTGEIGSELGDLGYRDVDGILERGGEWPAVRLEDGLVFASSSADQLRALPDEPADELPATLLGDLNGDDVFVSAVPMGCVRENGASVAADGDGEVAVLIDHEADPQGLVVVGSLDSEPQADGDIVTADAKPDDERPGALLLHAERIPGYDC